MHGWVDGWIDRWIDGLVGGRRGCTSAESFATLPESVTPSVRAAKSDRRPTQRTPSASARQQLGVHAADLTRKPLLTDKLQFLCASTVVESVVLVLFINLVLLPSSAGRYALLRNASPACVVPPPDSALGAVNDEFLRFAFPVSQLLVEQQQQQQGANNTLVVQLEPTYSTVHQDSSVWAQVRKSPTDFG
jgi:hypothetical protein